MLFPKASRRHYLGVTSRLRVLVLALAVGMSLKARAGEPAAFVTGDYQQYKNSVLVEGAGNQADYAKEGFGKAFRVSFPGLPEGIYTVEIDETETYLKGAGQRIMRVTSGDVVLADKLDIFVASGGFARPYTIRGKVNHAADAIGGPLTLSFEGIKDNAKFNVIRVLDAQGQIAATVRATDLLDPAELPSFTVPKVKTPAIYTDADQPVDARIDDLIARMSLHEKVEQLMQAAPAIPRLNVPEYHYWSEALHGVARAGHATVFPQAIGMAACWDEALVHRIGEVVGTEGRAKYLDAQSRGDRGDNRGLTFWAPNINIFRDPRWGRGQETYGEDPFLTARTGVAYITGMQGDDPRYLKTVACAKHFAVHSGPESLRHSFNATPPPRDLYETYLPQFQAAVEEAHVGSIMAAYSAINGVPSPADHWLLTDLLRTKWGFRGHVVSDCGAVGDVSGGHHYAASGVEAVAKTIKAGLDLECGGSFRQITKAVVQGLLTEKDVDTALHRVLLARFQLGLFDPPERVPFSPRANKRGGKSRAPRTGADLRAGIGRAAQKPGRPAA